MAFDALTPPLEVALRQGLSKLADEVRETGRIEALPLRVWLDLVERWRILDALQRSGGNRSAAARLLGIGRRTLYTKMEKFQARPQWSASAPATAAND